MTRLVTYPVAVLGNLLGRRTVPRFLTYVVTFACNARCVMCDSWKKPSPNDLTLDEVRSVFDELPRMDAVRLTGGEPFVREDLLEIADSAQEKLSPVVLHVTTNGFVTDRIVRFCEGRRKDARLKLLVSVDGVGEKHNRVRGHRGAWARVVETLPALAPRRRELRMDIAVNQTIVDGEGLRHYRSLRDFLAAIEVRNQVVMACDASATYHTNDDVELAPTSAGEFPVLGRFGVEELQAFFEEAQNDLSAFPLLERMAKRYYLRGIRNRLLRGLGAPNPRCVALRSHLRVLPDGAIPTCQFNTRSPGNLRRSSFDEVWCSERADQLRKWVKRCPGCWAESEVVPNAVYTGDLFTKASNHWDGRRHQSRGRRWRTGRRRRTSGTAVRAVPE